MAWHCSSASETATQNRRRNGDNHSTAPAFDRQPAELASHRVSRKTRHMLESVLAGRELSGADAVHLFRSRRRPGRPDGHRRRDPSAPGERRRHFRHHPQHQLHQRLLHGVSFLQFRQAQGRPRAGFFDLDEIVRRAQEAWDRGATEVCIRAACIRDVPGHFYRDMLRPSSEPGHASTPSRPSRSGSAHKSRLSTAISFDLVDNGLGSMPGTAAEILDTEVRKQLDRDKRPPPTSGWRSSPRPMRKACPPPPPSCSHIDGPEHWAAHIALLRDIQKRTGGFTEFVPLGFVHYKTALFLEHEGVRPGRRGSSTLACMRWRV
ncbi:hypothetical protein DSL92_03710 [Billgrantia gudaonensis]|uniref:Uncharacterized protein n=1 Tax=Billgrantia gudaonensis TaxID=376427 RepID=A0A432JJP6_9GAMM|nr:hypothetical protein DSL92_03710 [Halomonas gudaonensis]